MGSRLASRPSTSLTSTRSASTYHPNARSRAHTSLENQAYMTRPSLYATNLEEHIMAAATPQITSRFSIRDLILTLDPVVDHQQICYLSTCYDFPWDYTRALEFALFRTFGIAQGTPLLERTGEFLLRTRKRYDDTVLILGELLEHGY